MKTKAIVALVLIAAVSAAPALAQSGSAGANGDAPTYVIGPEDVLQIIVWKNEQLTRTVPVRPDGFISLPLMDDIKAAGLTTPQLREVLVKRLAEFMPSPEVSVVVIDVRSFKVSVIGEVVRPGRFELKSWTTVLDALAQAGGFTQFANRSRIVILRPNGRKMERIAFNYNKVITAGGEDENFYLQPNDIILVP
jgi:polysaccharide export outer membrane protein